MSWTLDPKYVPANVKWARQAPTHLNDTISALQGRPRDVSTLRPRPTTLSERIASAIVPDGRKWTDMRNKVSGAVDALTPLGAEQPLRDARTAYQGGNKWGAAGLGALAMLGAVPGVGTEAKAGTRSAKGIFGKRGIIAYHGSPHSFDRFSLDKIGTGEGAQAYGHGLYFTENERVAGQYLRRPGHMYQVRINANPEDFLDWDRGVKEQNDTFKALFPEYVNPPSNDEYFAALAAAKNGDSAAAHAAERMKQIGRARQGGDGMYNDIANGLRGAIDVSPHLLNNDVGKALASERLKAAGIPGIKYIDTGSHDAGRVSERAQNYVVFDDALIEILKKYGIAVPAMGLGVAGMSRQPEGGM